MNWKIFLLQLMISVRAIHPCHISKLFRFLISRYRMNLLTALLLMKATRVLQPPFMASVQRSNCKPSQKESKRPSNLKYCVIWAARAGKAICSGNRLIPKHLLNCLLPTALYLTHRNQVGKLGTRSRYASWTLAYAFEVALQSRIAFSTNP